MRVLIDLTSLADNFSGIERYAACLTEQMIKDMSVDYILIFKESVHPIFEQTVKQKNVNTVVLPRCNKLLFNQIVLPNAIRKITADWYLFLAFPVPVLLFKKNMVSTIHDICCWDCPDTMNGMSSIYFRISHRVALLKCKRIITISRFSERRIVEKLHYDPNKIWRIYCGVDNKFLNYKSSNYDFSSIKKKYNLPDHYILSLSTLEPRKNLIVLIKAYSKMLKNGDITIPLVLAGRTGWKMNQLLDSIDPMVKDRIVFTGFVDDEDLPCVYGSADIFVFASMYEGFGMPPLEAAVCGTKVLSSNSSSLPEVLGDKTSYFENNNVESLEMELRNILSCYEQKCEKMYIPEKFLWEKQGKKLIKKLKDLNYDKERKTI